MCRDCGCEEGNAKHHYHGNGRDHEVQTRKTLDLEHSIMHKNDAIAHENWHFFDDHGITCVNLMSSPGAGKTFLLEKTLQALSHKLSVAVLVGDQQTDYDALRLENKGGKVKQINTHASCHLDAAMIQRELGCFVDGSEDLLIIENVGNLVCPAAFNLGSRKKIALLSIPEGEDKPVKYPTLFHDADLILMTKIDLANVLDWNRKRAHDFVRQVNQKAEIFDISAKTGEGLNSWLEYLVQISNKEKAVN